MRRGPPEVWRGALWARERDAPSNTLLEKDNRWGRMGSYGVVASGGGNCAAVERGLGRAEATCVQ